MKYIYLRIFVLCLVLLLSLNSLQAQDYINPFNRPIIINLMGIQFQETYDEKVIVIYDYSQKNKESASVYNDEGIELETFSVEQLSRLDNEEYLYQIRKTTRFGEDWIAVDLLVKALKRASFRQFIAIESESLSLSSNPSFCTFEDRDFVPKLNKQDEISYIFAGILVASIPEQTKNTKTLQALKSFRYEYTINKQKHYRKYIEDHGKMLVQFPINKQY